MDHAARRARHLLCWAARLGEGARRDAKENNDFDDGTGRRDRPNMKCRMCSRPLTRVGRLCRECDHELARMRQGAPALDGVEMVVPESRSAEGAKKRPRHRARTIVVLAFCVGILGAAGLRFALVNEHRVPTRSVMLDSPWSTQPGATGSEAQRAAVTPR